MLRLISLAALQMLLLYFCFVYLYEKVNYADVLKGFSSYSVTNILLLFLYSLLHYWLRAFRLQFILDKCITIRQSLTVTFLSYGVNAVLPAKLGELARVGYLNQQYGQPLHKVVAAIFWERLTDLNVLVVCFLLVLFFIDLPVLHYFGAIFVALWLLIVVALLNKHWLRFVIYRLPIRRVKVLAYKTYKGIMGLLSPGKFKWVVLLSFTLYIQYFFQFYLAFNLVAGMQLPMAKFLLVFAVLLLSITVPSTPGSLGVFEASVVLALSWFGVNEGEALAIAIFIHLMNILPGLLVTIVVALSLTPAKLVGFIRQK